VDVSPGYGSAEAHLGAFFRGTGQRLKVLAKYSAGPDRADWTPSRLISSLERTLETLSVERVEGLLLHSPPLTVLSEDLLATLLETKTQGLANHVGLSCDEATLRWAIDQTALDVVQTSVNLFDQVSLPSVSKAHERGMLVVAKRSLANCVWRNLDHEPGAYTAEYRRRLLLSGEDHREETWLDLAARFTAYTPGVDLALFSTGSPAHLDEVMDAVERGPLLPGARAFWEAMAASHPDWAGQN
jgi:aryl-alcohol dehydrogenase-like predicted oxidoreductase